MKTSIQFRGRRRVEKERFQDNVVFNVLKADAWLSTGEIANFTGINNSAVAMALTRLHNAGCIDIRMLPNTATPNNFLGWGSHRVAKKRVQPAGA